MNHTLKTGKSIPVPGQRIFRSLAAVLLCFAVYELRGRHGMPFYSAIAALQCVQQYNRSMHTVARRRVSRCISGKKPSRTRWCIISSSA